LKRRDREITTRSEIDEVIRRSTVCRVGFAVEGEPYIVPLSFGYDGEALYFHTALTGRKIDCIQANPRACFELDCNVNLVTDNEDACKWTFTYESVIGYGTLTELEDKESKVYGLNQVMRQYSGREWSYKPSALGKARVWRLSVESVSGKRSLPKGAAERGRSQ
jgi:nitroimidazol reductase NimA-like FMN-containing flavoprotein (pyridoxamine 5'-phosphate oxidase superfamily)